MIRAITAVSVGLVMVVVLLVVKIDHRSKDLRQLNRFAAAGNSLAPRMIDELTRLERVSVQFPALIFRYTVLLPAADIDVDALEEQQLMWFREVACSDDKFQSMVIQPGYEVVRAYVDRSHVPILTVRLSHRNCTTPSG